MTRRKGRKEGKEGKDDLLHSLVTFNFYLLFAGGGCGVVRRGKKTI